MQDAFGGILNITIVAVFMILVSGILAMTVNYTRAFRMKNYVISTIEQYEGSGCGCNDNNSGSIGSSCRKKIEGHAKSLGYSPKNITCNANQKAVDGFFCCEMKKSGKEAVYSVSTQIDIDFPIINRIMSAPFFRVTGDTRSVRTNY